MDDTEVRLTRCFSAIFPSLLDNAISTSTSTNTEGWDSVASVTLFATVEEEFGIEIKLADSAALLSYAGFLDYLRTKTAASK